MKEQIRALKLNLKDIAQSIRNNKRLRKKSHPAHEKYIGDYALLTLREEYRHKHVAYCLVRGRTKEQVDAGVRLDMEYVNWIIKAMQPESKEKLYVVVNENLTPAQQAVQSAHAVAEFMRKNPNTMWRNGHLILLKGSPNFSGNMNLWVSGRNETAQFIEPDVGNKVTACAVFGMKAEQTLKNHKLV